ncbi:hypothetical protein FD754_024525, partial [Muntiacus muntjak]
KVQAYGVNPGDAYVCSGTHSIKPFLLYTPMTFTTRMISGGYTVFVLQRMTLFTCFPKKLDFKQGAAISISAYVKAGGTAGQMVRAYGLKILGTAATKKGQKIAFQNEAHEESSTKGVALPSFSKEAFQQFAATLQAGMEIGWLRPVIGPQYSLERAAQAHEDIIHSCGAMEK